MRHLRRGDRGRHGQRRRHSGRRATYAGLANPAWEDIMTATYSDLAGKVVLVTGGASGIGEAIVRRFAQQKSVVVFFDIKVEEGGKLARELTSESLRAHFMNVDLTDIAALRAGIAEARRTHGPINVLVNNAAHDER